MKRWRTVLTGLFLSVFMVMLLSINVNAQEQEIVIQAEHPLKTTGAVQQSQDGLVWSKDLESVSYTFQIPRDGLYTMRFRYSAQESKSDFIQLEGRLLSSGKTETFSIQLTRPVEYGNISTMENGEQVRAKTWISEKIEDVQLRVYDNVSNEISQWELSAGEVTLTLEGIRTDFILYEIILVPYESVQEYQQVESSALYQNAELASETITIKAENIYRSSEASLGAQYDRSDPLVEPSSAKDMLLNIAGGSSYNSDGQWMEWKFDVPQDGLYALKIKARQYYKNGLSVNRRIYIDGQVPFKEAENVSFTYSGKWQLVTLETEDGEDALLYLKEGTHVLRIEVVPGPEAEAIIGIKELVSELTDIYRSIVMITGVNPDDNRDYYLERDIPELMQNFQNISEKLLQQKKLLENLSGSKSGELSSIITLSTQIDSFIEEPDTIHKRLTNFKSNIDSLSSFMLTISDQPLDLDYILLAAPEEKEPAVNAGWWKKFCFELEALFYSFFPDEVEEEDVLTVWVSLGRDQMQVIKDMTDNGYTAQTGQKVEFSLVQQGITEAILAGNSPDVLLYVDNQEIVNLAMRGALESLDDVEGIEKLIEECQSESFVPYEYKGEYYGIPFTQSFPMMFVRTDIFEELGLKIPETWEELYAIIPAIQRNNMQIGIPSGDQTYATMLWQHGQGYYLDGLTATNFQNQTAVDVFLQYTRLFTDYDLPVTYDFYNRFRSGEMPIGITDYTEYNRLLLAAPEITGKWAIYPVPGVKTESGIDYSVQSTSGYGGYVLSNSQRKDQAIDFLMWFAAAEQQAQYAKKSEALLGAIGRYAPANQQAFEYLAWLPEEQEIIMKQWQEVKEQPQMPGSYYTKRNLANAFRAVVYDSENYREVLLKFAGEIDRELERKAEEYQ